MKEIIDMIHQKCMMSGENRDILIKQIENTFENAYDKGYNDGANAAASDILN